MNLTWVPTDKKPDIEKITIVHGFCFHDNKVHELMKETAIREVKEETGIFVELQEVAFITEYRSRKYGSYLQVYFHALIDERMVVNEDPDHDIVEVLFVPKTNLREYMKYKAWILPLEEWIENPITKYHSYDQDLEGFYLE